MIEQMPGEIERIKYILKKPIWKRVDRALEEEEIPLCDY